MIIPRTSVKKIDVKQLNGSPQIEEHRKVRIHKDGEKILQNSSPGRVTDVKIILSVDHQDNILQRSWQSFPINYSISLRNKWNILTDQQRDILAE